MRGTSFVFRSERGVSPFHLAVKHYALDPDNRGGAVLILIHGAGLNKEVWEPLLQDLVTKQGNGRDTIAEAWTFDCPNHGEAAALNDEDVWRDKRNVTLEDFARAGLALLLSNRIANLDHRPLILAGHSAGAASAVILTALYHQYTSRLPDLFVFIEPPAELFLPAPSAKQMAESFLERTRKRRDIWPSREDAKGWFEKRLPWSNWDSRALDTFVQGGLRPLPTIAYPDKQGVTLSCYKLQEAFAYLNLGELNSASRLLRYLRHVRGVNVIYAGDSPLRPSEAAAKDIRERLGFQVDAVPGAGHLIVLEKPTELAGLFHKYWSQRNVQLQEKSRL